MEHTCDACSLWLTDECDHPDRMGRRNAPACEDFEGNRLAEARETIERMAEEIARLKAQIKELKNRPMECDPY